MTEMLNSEEQRLNAALAKTRDKLPRTAKCLTDVAKLADNLRKYVVSDPLAINDFFNVVIEHDQNDNVIGYRKNSGQFTSYNTVIPDAGLNNLISEYQVQIEKSCRPR